MSNSFCTLSDTTPLERKLVATAITYNDEEKRKQSLYLKKAYAKAVAYKQMKKAYYLAGMLKKLGDFNVCLLNDDNTFPTGLLFKVKELYAKAKATPKYADQIGELVVEDCRNRPEAYNIYRWSVLPPKLRPYQQECLEIASERHRGTFALAVGSGKTVLAANIIKQTGVNTLFVVPSSALLQQTYNVFSRYFGASVVQMVSSKDVKAKKKLKPILVATIQTLASLVKQGKIDYITNHINSLMIDEAHHSGASTFLDLIKHLDNVYYRYNFTGTYTRNDSKIMELWGVCDELLYKYSAAKATEEGYLTPVICHMRTLKGVPGNSYHDEYTKNYGSKQFLDAILADVQKAGKDKQILILVDRKELVGDQVHEWLSRAGIESTYVTGDNDKKELSKAMQDFNEKKINILIASTVLGEGADITSTDILIMARGGKSEIAMTQAVGRAVRLAVDKHMAIVIDYNWEATRWLGKHSAIRLDVYAEEFACKFIKT